MTAADEIDRGVGESSPEDAVIDDAAAPKPEDSNEQSADEQAFVVATAEVVAEVSESSPVDSADRSFSLILRDALDLPVAGLEVFVALPDGMMCTARTTAAGAITVPLPAQPKGEAQVHVQDISGKHQRVCSLDTAQCENAVIVRSPKLKLVLPLRPHQQSQPRAGSATSPEAAAGAPGDGQGSNAPDTASRDWWRSNGALDTAWAWLKQSVHPGSSEPPKTPNPAVLAQAVSLSGHPVTIVAGPECPNKQGLRLGKNNVYREALLDASSRLGLIPQALCALIECEANKVIEHIPRLGPDGKQLKDKKGRLLTTRVADLWNPHSGREAAAAGLTQFLRGTWLSHVMSPGYYIHEQSKAKGWVRQEPAPQRPGRLRAAVRSLPGVKPRLIWVFELGDGSTTAAPGRFLQDINVRECLAMRNDPTWSIHAAADYGIANLQVLTAKGFDLKGLSDMDRAKLMYLMHHEGEGAGPLFVRNRLADRRDGVEGLRTVFAQQIGTANALRQIEKARGDVESAYRRWLQIYIDDKFSEADTRYFCVTPKLSTKLSELLTAIGGSAI